MYMCICMCVCVCALILMKVNLHMPCSIELKASNFLQKCTFKQLNQIHAFILTAALHRNDIILLKFLRRSTEFGGMEYPNLIFTQLSGTLNVKETSLWNIMIRGYAYNGPFDKCVSMFVEMPQRRLKPNNYTYPYVVNSCGQLGWYGTGKAVQCQVIKAGFETAFSVAESLFNLYVKMADDVEMGVDKTERINDARKIFNEVAVKPVELWNRMISGHVSAGDVNGAREVFDKMPERDIVSWNSMISGYSRVGDVTNASDLFERMPEKNVVSWTSMIKVYTVSQDFKAARNLFEKMPERNVVSWNSMISGYAQNGKFEEALDLFSQMQMEGVVPDGFTFVSALSACSHLGALHYGKWVHSLMEDWSNLAVTVGTALVEMYAKCGDVNTAFTVFIKIYNKDVFCYNVIIKSLAIHGKTKDAVKLFYMMQNRGLRPNEFTFSSVLFACSHGGLVEEGRKIFSSIENYLGTSPTIDHYSCMIDLLSRNGLIEEAESVVKMMPCEPDNAIWGSILGGCLVRGDVKVAEYVIEKASKVKENESGVYVLLSNIHASVGQWQEAKGAREKMEDKNITKRIGLSGLYYGTQEAILISE